MAITIPTITALPTPPQKSDSVNFPARADAFVVAQEAMATELAATIIEMNKLVGGLDQATPIAAYDSGTTYDFPDVVAYTDGYSYRCVDAGVVGITPGTDENSWIVISANGVEIAANITALQSAIDSLELLVGSGVLGVGQTRQDLTASRTNGVTYTNNTGRPIFVSIIMVDSGTVAGTLYVDGEPADTGKIRSTSSLTLGYTLNAVVLPGEEYILSGTTPDYWIEIR